MGRVRDVDRERFWRDALRRRAVSEMTVGDFCAQEGLKATTYQYWQREIRRRDRELETLDGATRAAATRTSPRLAAVRVVDDRLAVTRQAADARVEIVAKNGYLVRCGEQATTEQLRRVLQAVSELG